MAVIDRGVGDPRVVSQLVKATQFQVHNAGAGRQVVPFVGNSHFFAPCSCLVVIIGKHLAFIVLLDKLDAKVEPEQIGLKVVDHLFGFVEPPVEKCLVGTIHVAPFVLGLFGVLRRRQIGPFCIVQRAI